MSLTYSVALIPTCNCGEVGFIEPKHSCRIDGCSGNDIDMLKKLVAKSIGFFLMFAKSIITTHWISFGGRKTLYNSYLLDMLAMSIFQGHIFFFASRSVD